jgi:hypothetical protein
MQAPFVSMAGLERIHIDPTHVRPAGARVPARTDRDIGRKHAMKSRWWWAVCLTAAIAGASCSSQCKGRQAAGPGGQAPISTGAAGGPAAPALVATRDLGALVDLIVADASELPRVEFDPAALAGSLGNDPRKPFEWVRDHTWWVPYRGLLRGAQGVMLDRVGNSLDRAVLLGQLMRQTGQTVRLAHTQLTENRARELLAKVRPVPDERRPPVASRPVAPERQKAIEALMPGHEKSLPAQLADAKRRSDEAGALVRSQSDLLLTTLRDNAAQNPTGDEAAIAALQDHWWIEREDHGKWIAMDVLLPDAAIGDALAAASEISEWPAHASAPAIPATNWHTVQIRVVVERYQSGETTESTALEAVLRPAEVLERPIVLGHMPRPWPTPLPESRADPNVLKGAALQVKKWVPFLQVGDDLITQSAFTDGGELTSISTDSPGGLGGAGGIFGGFGSALGGDAPAETYATAEWIDYEVRVPGQPSQRLRRTVFDLLGPSKRSAKAAGFDVKTDALKLERFDALRSQTDILLQPCEFTQGFVAHLMTAGIVANQAALRELARARGTPEAKRLATAILRRIHPQSSLPDLALWRSVLGRHPADWYIDRPNVLNYRIIRPVVSADRASLRELIDIASNSLGVRRSAGRNAFEVRLRQGVTDTVSEMLALGSDLRLADNTASVFAMAGAGPDRGLLIAPRDAAAMQRLGWPSDAVARLAEHVGAGFMVVVLKEPVVLRERPRVGWWRVDPMSGETIGVMDSGFHQGMTEEEIADLKASLRAFLDEDAAGWQELRNFFIQQGPRNGAWAPNELWLREAVAQVLEDMAALGL